jgi:hypothetical protein
VLNELNSYTSWLSAQGARGVISEIGWPQNADPQQWNRVVAAWVVACNRAALPVLWFVAQGSPGRATGQVTMYTRASGDPTTTSISVANSQAPVAEANMTRGTTWRGVHMFGPDANDGGGNGNASVYNNTKLGTYGTDYWYEPVGSYAYLASRGATVVRIPFKWERIQTSLNVALNVAELGRLQQAVTNAGNSGLKAVLDCHSYGQYMFASGRFAIGTTAVPQGAFADLWTRLATAFVGNTTVLAYSLMNEPHDLPISQLGEPGSRMWESASQAAVTAIRAVDTTTEIHVSGYEWSHAPFFPKNHPRAWITDPSNNIRYEAHHYLYLNRSTAANYPDSYSTELANVPHLWSRYMTPGRTYSSFVGATWSEL